MIPGRKFSSQRTLLHSHIQVCFTGLTQGWPYRLWGVKLIRLKAGKVVTLSASNFMDYLAGPMQARES